MTIHHQCASQQVEALSYFVQNGPAPKQLDSGIAATKIPFQVIQGRINGGGCRKESDTGVRKREMCGFNK
jgi:hypothetical protein